MSETLEEKVTRLEKENESLNKTLSSGKIEYPKMIYNKDNVAVTVQNIDEHEPLKPYFNGKWDAAKGFSEISYAKALECLGDVKTETEQEVAVRREKEAKAMSLKDAEKLKIEKEGETAVLKEKHKLSFQPVIKNLPSYGWNELRTLGKEIEVKLGVELPLRAKRDVIEEAIIEVLKDDNDSK